MLFRLKGQEYEIEGIIFDKDGTLLDSEMLWPELIETRMGQLKKMGISEDIIENCRRTLGISPDGKDLDRNGPFVLTSRMEEMTVTSTVLYQGGYPWNEVRKMVEEAYNKAELKLDIDKITKPFPGVKDFLKDLKERGYKIGIATADSKSRSEKMLHSAGLMEYIYLMVAREMVQEGKPKPDMLNYISKEWNIPCNKMIMVGDTISDIEMAIAAECIPVGVLTGESSKDEMEKVAVKVIEEVTILKDYLKLKIDSYKRVLEHINEETENAKIRKESINEKISLISNIINYL